MCSWLDHAKLEFGVSGRQSTLPVLHRPSPVPFCPLLSPPSVSFCLLLSLSVSFCLLLLPSVSFCLLLSPSVSFCLLLSPSVSFFCLLLSPSSVSFCLLLSPFASFCLLSPFPRLLQIVHAPGSIRLRINLLVPGDTKWNLQDQNMVCLNGMSLNRGTLKTVQF